MRERIYGKQFEDGPVMNLFEHLNGLEDDEPVVGGGESCAQFRTRVINCLNEILENHSGTVLIFAHGLVCGLITDVIGIPHAHTKNAIPYYFQHDGTA